MKTVRALMIGDIIGEIGLKTLEKGLPALIKEHNIDFVTVNGENAAEGFGMTESDFRRIIAAGADVVTSGNHIWEKRDFWPVLENEKAMLRPANYPSDAPGRGFALLEKNAVKWLVINLQGREFMGAIDCPFQCFDRVIAQADAAQTGAAQAAQAGAANPIVLVDFHAESSREKEALGFYSDGRASLFAGTHTHVQTADERILPKGCAYITDLGMSGLQNSVIGMDPKICSERFRKQVQYQMKTAETAEIGALRGALAEIDADSGAAVSVRRV
jgi:metallophosphoesterase (TIGR00282 family)